MEDERKKAAQVTAALLELGETDLVLTAAELAAIGQAMIGLKKMGALIEQNAEKGAEKVFKASIAFLTAANIGVGSDKTTQLLVEEVERTFLPDQTIRLPVIELGALGGLVKMYLPVLRNLGPHFGSAGRKIVARAAEVVRPVRKMFLDHSDPGFTFRHQQ